MSNHYGQSNADLEAKKIIECREIVKRIIDFGVDNTQILNIIQFLALNLENHEQMVEITQLVKSFNAKSLIIDKVEE